MPRNARHPPHSTALLFSGYAMDADDDFDPADEHDDGPRYADVATFEGWEIPTALQGLTLFRDPYLSMQAQNLAIVDHFLTGLEQHVMRRLFEEDRTPIDDAMFLNAQSQMWIFAAYAVAGIQLVPDPDYCSPDDLRVSLLLVEVPDMLEVVGERELQAWATRPDPIAVMQDAQDRILEVARALDPVIENLNDRDAFVQAYPQHDDTIAEAYRDTGYLEIWRNDFPVNPWHYDLAEMEAVTTDRTVDEMREYCISTIGQFHTGGMRFAVNLAHYKGTMHASPRRTTFQLVQLYRQLVQNDHMRRIVALGWLDRRYPADARAEMQCILPHTKLRFSIVDRVEPRLGMIARMNIEASGTAACCSSCGDPADDFQIVNGAEAMPGVPSVRLCLDCAGIRSGNGEILAPIGD